MNFSRVSLLDRRYCVTRLLAQHGVETHYAARHVALDRPVRLVFLPTPHDQDYVHSDDVCEWTTRAAALRHPVLPRVRDCFHLEDRMCIVIDEPQGQSLAHRVAERGALTEREIVAAGILVADALDLVHRRDAGLLPLFTITPDALMLTPDQRVTLSYLRPRATLAQPEPCVCSRCKRYQAPEALRGEPADARADLYSLAAVLKEALALPSPATDSSAASASDALAEVLTRALAADARDRYQSPADFASALAEAGTTTPGWSRPEPHGAVSARPTVDAAVAPARSVRSAAVSSSERSSLPLRTDTQIAPVAAGRARVRHSGRRALIAIASALHIPA